MHWLPIVFMVIGFFGAIAGAGLLVTGIASRRWPHVAGEITLSRADYEVRERDGVTSTDYSPTVEYRYSVDGREYHGNEINVRGHGTSLSEVQAILAKYPAGRAVNVYYNPARPAEALLEPGASWSTALVLLASIAFIVLAILAIMRGSD